MLNVEPKRRRKGINFKEHRNSLQQITSAKHHLTVQQQNKTKKLIRESPQERELTSRQPELITCESCARSPLVKSCKSPVQIGKRIGAGISH